MKANLSTLIRIARLAAGRWSVASALLCAVGMRAAEPTFTNVTATVAPELLQGDSYSPMWGDYDNDGRLDFLLQSYFTFTTNYGNGSSSTYNVVRPPLWRNTGSGFTNLPAALTPDLPYSISLVTWADYDGDGRLDFFIAGERKPENSPYYARVSEIWRNTGNGFTNVTASVAPGLPAVDGDAVAWGDYDNDGRPDLLITGSYISQIWRNTVNGFTNVTATVAPGLPGIREGAVAWGDYDNDGRLDFLLTGGIPRRTDLDDDTSMTPIAQLWRNTGSRFENVTSAVTPGLPGVHWSSVAWGDYDNDGRLDFLISGWNRALYSGVSQLWRNTGSNFVNVTATVAPGLPDVYFGGLVWNDYDNDGRLDFLLTGARHYPGGIFSQVWRNTGSGFTNVTASVAPGLPGVVYASVAWGDYDGDGRTDFLLAGALDDGCDVCDPPPTTAQLWKNNTAQTNPPATVITKVLTSVSPTGAVLNGAIHPHHQASAAWFVWGDSTNYGHVTAAQPTGNGNAFTNFSQAISGLSTGVTYYYRAVGSNDQGQILGVEQRFLLAGPGVTTSPVGEFSPNTATIKGQVTPNNLPTYGWFEWGFTPACDQVTPVQFLGHGFNATLSENLLGLAIGTNFYFRAVVSNNLGVAYGVVQSLVMIDVPFMCQGSLSPTSKSLGDKGGAGYSVYVLLQCGWIVINTNSWITITSPTNGGPWGGNSLTFDVAANNLPVPRSGNITIGGHNFLVTQASGLGGLVVQPPAQSVLAEGTATFNVAVFGFQPATFQWYCNSTPLTNGGGISGATSSNLVLTGVQYAQAGSYVVAVAIADTAVVAYSSPATLTVLCNFALSSSEASFGSLSSTGQIALSATADCPWNIVNTNAWVTILSGINNSGDGAVVYALAENPTTLARSGSLRIAEQTFTIAQAGGIGTNASLSLAEALDTEGALSWGTVGTPAWFGQTVLSHDGVDAAQSGSIGHNGAVTVQTTVIGPGTISFWWKVSSETNDDYLKFFINGEQQTRISGEEDWQQQTFAIPSGGPVLKWTYSKDYSGTAGQDRGWLDQVRYVPSNSCNLALLPINRTHSSTSLTGLVLVSTFAGCSWTVINTNAWVEIVSGASGSGNGQVEYLLTENAGAARSGNLMVADQLFTITQLAPSTNAISLAEALDTVGIALAWDTIGAPVWFGQTSTSHDGMDAAQSGAVNHNAAVTLQTTVEGPGAISFWWKVSSEDNKDYLKFFINGVQQTRISGEVNWESQRFIVPAGTQVFKWTYSKNATGSWGLDRGWVDQVRFLAGAGECVVTLSHTSATHSPNSETGQINVATDPGCTWGIINTNAWITPTVVGGDGNGFVRYALAANDSSLARTGLVTVAGQLFTVVQLGVVLSSLAEALDTVGTPLVWITAGNGPWFGQSAVTHDGVDAAQSGAVSGGGGSLQTTVTGPGTLTFWWKISSPETNSDLRFYVGSSQTARIIGEVDWQQRTVAIPPGVYYLLWIYTRTTGFVSGQNCGWVDQVQFVPTAVCPVTLSPGNASHPSGSSTGVVNVAAASDCAWSMFNTNSWISILSGSGGTGNGSVIYTVAANPSVNARSGNVRIADQIFLVTQSGGSTNLPGCTYSILPGTRTHGYGAATNTVTVTAGAGCAWTISNTNSWITFVSGTSGTGSGTVGYSITANDSPNARSGNVQIAGVNFALTQNGAPGGCTYVLSPTGRAHGSAFSTGVVSITTSAGCAWQVLNTNSWVSMDGPTNGTGGGQVIYSVAANPNASSRSGSLSIGGQPFFISQTGAVATCAYVISPVNATHGPSEETNIISVTTTAGCAWTTVNTNAWVAVLSGASGTGPGTVLYKVVANPSANTRSGNLRIDGQLFAITQTGTPGGACTYTFSATNRTHDFGSATGLVSVTTTAGCAWTAVESNTWVNIIAGHSGASNGVVRYLVTANTNSASRTGNIYIAGQTFTLTQLGRMPVIRLDGLAAGGGAMLSVEGNEGRTNVVEWSADLIHWYPISTNSLPGTITDSAGTNAPRRFYRSYEWP